MKRRKLSISKSCGSRKKITGIKRLMFIGTQCDLWGRPDGTGHEKISRGNFPRLIFSLIPSLFERHISIGCADLIWDITLDEISALCLFFGRGPFFRLTIIEHPLIALQRCISLRCHTSCKESATPAEEIPELSAGQAEW